MPMVDNDLLNGWKEIANYLNVSPKTARRWERSDRLPILRPEGRREGSVLARKSSLDAWLQGTLERVVMESNRLVGLTRSGKIAWTYECPAPVRHFSPEEVEWRIQRVDLSNAGDQGVLFTARFADTDQPDIMYYISSKGKLQWLLEADPHLLDRNGSSFEKAWMFKHVLVTPGSNGPTVWAALANEASWAGCVLQIDSRGTPSVKLANAGYVEWLCHIASPLQDSLIVCGENNAFDQSFVALLGINDPACSSPPGGRPRYQYSNAPAGSPQRYVLFPRTELVVARQKPYGHAWKMRQFPEHIIVEVETGADGGFFLYHFTPQLAPKYVFPSGSHEFRHRDLERAGRIDHAWSDCPELDQPLWLNVWELDLGWRDEPIRWRDNPWREV
jgi:hypothetical protein